MTNRNGYLIIAFSVILVIVLAFTGLLTVTDFQQNYTESLISSYAVSGRQSVQKIEYAVRYGKPLENFYGIEELLFQVAADFPEISSIRVENIDGLVLYDITDYPGDSPESPGFGFSALFDGWSDSAKAEFFYKKDKDFFRIFFPINDSSGDIQGRMQVVFPAGLIIEKVNEVTLRLLFYLLLFALFGLIFINIFCRRSGFFDESKKLQLKQKKFLIVTMIFLGLVQILFGSINYNYFKNDYLNIARENAAKLSGIIARDIEAVVDKGVSYDQLYRLEEYFESIAADVPEIQDIALFSEEEEVLYHTARFREETKEKLIQEQDDNDSLIYSMPLKNDNVSGHARLTLKVSENYLALKLRDILLDSATMLLLSMILMVEVVIFITILLNWQFDKKRFEIKKKLDKALDFVVYTDDKNINGNERGPDLLPKEAPAVGNGVVRMLSLIVGIAVFMSASFIPLRMKELLEPILGFSESIILALPISAEMFFAAVSSVLAGRLVDRKGWRLSVLLGLIVFAFGLFLSYYASNSLTFILARAFSGAGYGFSLLSIRGFVNQLPSEKERTGAFSASVSGLYAGFIIGVVIGAMLADRIGFARVFLAAMVFSVLAVILVVSLFKEKGEEKNVNEGSGDSNLKPVVEKSPHKYSVFSFLSNYKVLSYFLFLIIPLTICIMFVDYYFPIFAAGEGVSTSDIGRAFMLNGMAVAYLGPFLSKFTLLKFGTLKSIFLSGFIISGGLLLFYYFNNLTVAFMVVILMGVAESFGLTAQNNYYVSLKATNDFGRGAALGYAANMRKMGQMLGPVVFGSLVVLGEKGFAVVGAFTFIAIIIFSFTSRKGFLEQTR